MDCAHQGFAITKRELGLGRERSAHPLKATLVTMLGETTGGLAPLLPYLITQDIQTGFIGAIVVTFASLFAIGLRKTTLTTKKN